MVQYGYIDSNTTKAKLIADATSSFYDAFYTPAAIVYCTNWELVDIQYKNLASCYIRVGNTLMYPIIVSSGWIKTGSTMRSRCTKKVASSDKGTSADDAAGVYYCNLMDFNIGFVYYPAPDINSNPTMAPTTSYIEGSPTTKPTQAKPSKKPTSPPTYLLFRPTPSPTRTPTPGIPTPRPTPSPTVSPSRKPTKSPTSAPIKSAMSKSQKTPVTAKSKRFLKEKSYSLRKSVEERFKERLDTSRQKTSATITLDTSSFPYVVQYTYFNSSCENSTLKYFDVLSTSTCLNISSPGNPSASLKYSCDSSATPSYLVFSNGSCSGSYNTSSVDETCNQVTPSSQPSSTASPTPSSQPSIRRLSGDDDDWLSGDDDDLSGDDDHFQVNSFYDSVCTNDVPAIDSGILLL